MFSKSFAVHNNTNDDGNISDDDVIIKNISEKKNVQIFFTRCSGEESIKATRKNIISWNHLDYLQSVIKDVFLPEGYPNSVSSDYLEYQLWDTCQAFCSSISGTFCMSAVMKSVGVGSETATPVSAAITWILKDGTGMIGSILFAWSKGSRLDSDCKKWRLFADVMNDAAMCLELYIPSVMDMSVYLLCLSTTMKALVGVAGSATRAALTCHQAIQGNMADVSAKDGSQEIFVNLCASIFGIFLLKNVTEADTIWMVMFTFILLHLYSNYKAVSCLKINVYNGERFRLSLRTFLSTADVPKVMHVNRNESVILGRGTSNRVVFGFDIYLGVTLEDVVLRRHFTADDLSFLVVLFQTKNYLLLPLLQNREILVTFRKNCSGVDVLNGYFHALLLTAAMNLVSEGEPLPFVKRRRNNSPVSRLEKVMKEVTSKKTDLYKSISLPVVALLSCDQVVKREFALFCKLSVDQGWDLSRNLILLDDWRAEWKHEEEKVAHVEIPTTKRDSTHPRPSDRKRSTVQNAQRYINHRVILNI